MARKRNEVRSIISTDRGAAAAPATRRTTRPSSVQHSPSAPVPEAASSHNTAIDSVVNDAHSHKPNQPVSAQDEIARLAYSFWEERGGQGGSAEQDWLRAEQEFQRRRQASTS